MKIHKISQQEITDIVSISLSHISSEAKDEMAIPSYTHKNPMIRWLMWKRYECASEMAAFSKDMNVLEFGCGIGLFLPEMSRMNAKVYAIDLFPEYAEILSNKFDLNVRFIRCLSDLQDGSVDIIIALDVLEHIHDLSDYLTKFRHLLKRDGCLIVSGPTENIFYKMGRIAAGFHDKGDYHYTNIDDIFNQIEEAGFSLATVRKLPFVIPPCLFKIGEFRRT